MNRRNPRGGEAGGNCLPDYQIEAVHGRAATDPLAIELSPRPIAGNGVA